mmetsp:Transcript_13758/g.41474  ORF Transcript_13758/g.41474 Transcript_13758/m.41474 type:complete len:217 (+) Transcript_13758:841-1491(+)
MRKLRQNTQNVLLFAHREISWLTEGFDELPQSHAVIPHLFRVKLRKDEDKFHLRLKIVLTGQDGGRSREVRVTGELSSIIGMRDARGILKAADCLREATALKAERTKVVAHRHQVGQDLLGREFLVVLVLALVVVVVLSVRWRSTRRSGHSTEINRSLVELSVDRVDLFEEFTSLEFVAQRIGETSTREVCPTHPQMILCLGTVQLVWTLLKVELN